jgi:hypothetical protein
MTMHDAKLYQWAITQEREALRLARQSNDELQWKIKQLQAEIRYLKDPLNDTMKLTRAKRIQREDRVFAYRETGMTFIAIGKILKMSPARVSQCYWTAFYRRKHDAETALAPPQESQ